MNRAVKQLIYGSLYVVILVGIGWGVWAGAKPAATCTDGRLNQGEAEVDCDGPCAPCAIRRLRPIEAGGETLFRVGDAATLLFEFRNPNATYGAARLSYTVNLMDAAGAPVRSFTRPTTLYPTEIRQVFEPELGVPFSAIARAAVAVDPASISWEPLASFPLPRTMIRSVSVEQDVSLRRAIVTATLSNENPFPLRRAVVVAMVVGAFGTPLAASETLLLDLAPGEERAFRIAIPEVPIEGVTSRDIRFSVEASR